MTVNEQESQRRWIIHLLHFVPERRGTRLEVIEDVIPLLDLTFQVRTSYKVKTITAFSRGNQLSFEDDGSALKIQLPKIDGHEMLMLQWE